MAKTILKQVEDLRAELSEKQEIGDWLEDVWSDIAETEHMASLLMGHAEDLLDTSHGKPDGMGGVALRFQTDSIDLLHWVIGKVWRGLKDLDEHVNVRINAITAAENAANDPRVLKIKRHTIGDGEMIDCIDRLRNALDRMDALEALVKQLPKGHQSAIERVTGDIHDLVTETHNALQAVREKPERAA